MGWYIILGIVVLALVYLVINIIKTVSIDEKKIAELQKEKGEYYEARRRQDK